MNRTASSLRGTGDQPTDIGLLSRPLDFISEDHLRERQICARIDALAQAEKFDRGAGLSVLRFLNEELVVHIRDETEHLFPLLSQRCTEEDAIDTAINRIRADQRALLHELGLQKYALDEASIVAITDPDVLRREVWPAHRFTIRQGLHAWVDALAEALQKAHEFFA